MQNAEGTESCVRPPKPQEARRIRPEFPPQLETFNLRRIELSLRPKIS